MVCAWPCEDASSPLDADHLVGRLVANATVLNATLYDTGANATDVGDDYLLELPEKNQFEQPWWQQLVWTVLFGGMVVVATGGNLIVIWIVLAHRRMRTVTNYFLVNLSVADTMVSTLNVIFNFIYMLNGDWPFGYAFCKISNFVAVLSIAASVFTLMAISIDRYMAIMFPLKPRMSRAMTLNIAAAIWVVSSALSLPNLLYATTFEERFQYGDRTVCYMEWPDGPMTESNQEYIYNVSLMILTYFLPVAAMSFTYTRVGFELWGSRSIGECTTRQMENIKAKRRVVKMMIVVVVIFAVCWLPFHIYFIVAYHYREITFSTYIQQVFLAIYWLAMSNSMYNPIIYCWMNSRFRRGFKQAFQWCPGVRFSDDDLLERRAGQLTTHYSCSGSPDHLTRLDRNGTIIVPLHELTHPANNATTTTSTTTTTTTSTTTTTTIDNDNNPLRRRHDHQQQQQQLLLLPDNNQRSRARSNDRHAARHATVSWAADDDETQDCELTD